MVFLNQEFCQIFKDELIPFNRILCTGQSVSMGATQILVFCIVELINGVMMRHKNMDRFRVIRCSKAV
jgi:hypothetical protein